MSNKLNPAFKEKWIAALESGEYLQGTGYMSMQEPDSEGNLVWKNCCIGVACRLLGYENDDIEGDTIPVSSSAENASSHCSSVGLTPEVISVLWRCNDGFSLSDFDYWFKKNSETPTRDLLLKVNPDGTPMTFKEIANVIRENF